MKLFLRKKLMMALLAGCSVIAVNAVSLAAEADPAPVTAAHEQAAADFDKATQPADTDKEAAKSGTRDQRAVAFLNQLVKQQKLTSEEANSLIAFMAKSHEEFAKMDDAQRQAYKEKIQAMSEDERYAELSKGTGISSDRLKEIFTIIRDEIKAQAEANQQQAK